MHTFSQLLLSILLLRFAFQKEMSVLGPGSLTAFSLVYIKYKVKQSNFIYV